MAGLCTFQSPQLTRQSSEEDGSLLIVSLALDFDSAILLQEIDILIQYRGGGSRIEEDACNTQ